MIDQPATRQRIGHSARGRAQTLEVSTADGLIDVRMERCDSKMWCEASDRPIKPTLCVALGCEGRHFRMWRESDSTPLEQMT